jgi:hypothetical protein
LLQASERQNRHTCLRERARCFVPEHGRHSYTVGFTTQLQCDGAVGSTGCTHPEFLGGGLAESDATGSERGEWEGARKPVQNSEADVGACEIDGRATAVSSNDRAGLFEQRRRLGNSGEVLHTGE